MHALADAGEASSLSDIYSSIGRRFAHDHAWGVAVRARVRRGRSRRPITGGLSAGGRSDDETALHAHVGVRTSSRARRLSAHALASLMVIAAVMQLTAMRHKTSRCIWIHKKKHYSFLIFTFFLFFLLFNSIYKLRFST